MASRNGLPHMLSGAAVEDRKQSDGFTNTLSGAAVASCGRCHVGDGFTNSIFGAAVAI